MLQLKKYIDRLDASVTIAPLVTFRIVFGALMAFSVVRFMALGWIEDHYVNPTVHFKYYGFEWVEALPATWMYAIHFVMLLAAFGVMLGFYYRMSAIALFLTFTYTELIDLTYYLNHYYFVSLVSALMIILPAHRSFSFDACRKPTLASEQVHAWTILLIKLQLAIVYIYAGIAKINYDWLIQAVPMKIWLPANDQLPVLGSLLTLPAMPYLFSWLGMLYDCTIVFWLANAKTRPWAYISVLFFHIVTGMMFQIGVFPLVMIGATLIFFSNEWHARLINKGRQLLEKIFTGARRQPNVNDLAPAHPFIRTALVLFIAFQIVFPWRYLLYKGNLFWTEEGYRFSWRVMLMEKAGTATFYVKDSATGREGVVVNREFLNPHQEKQMAMQPDMILQFAHFLKNWYAKQGLYDPQVRAEVYVTLNAKPSKLLIDPAVNLAQLEDSWKQKDWILPMNE